MFSLQKKKKRREERADEKQVCWRKVDAHHTWPALLLTLCITILRFSSSNLFILPECREFCVPLWCRNTESSSALCSAVNSILFQAMQSNAEKHITQHWSAEKEQPPGMHDMTHNREFEQTARNPGNASANVTFGVLWQSKVTLAHSFPDCGLSAQTRQYSPRLHHKVWILAVQSGRRKIRNWTVPPNSKQDSFVLLSRKYLIFYPHSEQIWVKLQRLQQHRNFDN